MTRRDVVPATSGRSGYTRTTLGMLAVLVTLGCATPLFPRQGGLRDGVAMALALALFLGWHVLSYSRARAARLLGLMGAPTLTVLGGWLLMAVAIEGQAYFTDPPVWVTALGWFSLLGYPALLLWPAAWVALATVERKKVRHGAA